MTSGDATAPSSRADGAVELIERLISNGLRPGDRIGTKEELRQRTGVAVGTFNEALRLLVSRGSVTVRPGPGGGMFVAEPSASARLGTAVLALRSDQVGMVDVLRVRDALDPLVIDDAVAHATDADIADLRDLAAALGRAVHDPAEFMALNWELHTRMAKISPNAILRSLYTSLMDITRANTAGRYSEDAAAHKRSRSELHAEIVEAIALRDSRKAARLGRQHSEWFTRA